MSYLPSFEVPSRKPFVKTTLHELAVLLWQGLGALVHSDRQTRDQTNLTQGKDKREKIKKG